MAAVFSWCKSPPLWILLAHRVNLFTVRSFIPNHLCPRPLALGLGSYLIWMTYNTWRTIRGQTSGGIPSFVRALYDSVCLTTNLYDRTDASKYVNLIITFAIYSFWVTPLLPHTPHPKQTTSNMRRGIACDGYMFHPFWRGLILVRLVRLLLFILVSTGSSFSIWVWVWKFGIGNPSPLRASVFYCAAVNLNLSLNTFFRFMPRSKCLGKITVPSFRRCI